MKSLLVAMLVAACLAATTGGGSASEPVVAEPSKAHGVVHYYGAVYMAEEFLQNVLKPAHQRGEKLQMLMLPDESMEAVRTERELSDLIFKHFGEVPPLEFFADAGKQNARGRSLRKVDRSWRGDMNAGGASIMATYNCPNIHNLTARIWKHDNCGGDYLSSFGNDQVGDLNNYGHNDTTSSVQVGGGLDWFRGYWDWKFQGSVLNIYGNGDGTDKNWGAPALGTWNDKISSYKTGCSDSAC